MKFTPKDHASLLLIALCALPLALFWVLACAAWGVFRMLQRKDDYA